MRRYAILFLTAMLLSACAAHPLPSLEQAAIAIAVQTGLQGPELDGVKVVETAEPLKALSSGQAAAALVRGPVPDGYQGFLLRVSERVVLQGWLDPPLAFTQAEAATRLPGLGPPGAGHPGALAAGTLQDLKPGWRAVPVDGVAPTPETVWNGRYPVSERISAVVAPGAPAALVSTLETLATQPPSSWIQVSVAGDFMLARGVARAMREHGTLYPVERVREHLAAADIAFANLESPIGVKGTPLPGKGIWFRAAPEAIELLKAAGLDGVTVANNHIMDYDTENFLETLEALETAGIQFAGGGRDLAEARRPLVLESKGVKVAFLGYSQFADLFFDWGYPKRFAAGAGVPGVARIQDDWLREDIRRARPLSDAVVVTFHWGEEFMNYPTAEQQRLARLCIDLGADVVIGYHPHAIQGFEVYKDRFIAYSTGNFIMDRQETDLARESMILDVTVGPGGVRSVAVHPVWIRAEQPYIMPGAEGQRLLQKMRILSKWQ